jgi:tripartite-type tricarboxylate transporter receptor subunit TctC
MTGESKVNRRSILQLGLAASAALASANSRALSQSGFPTRPLRLVVPFPAGGPDDLLGRTFAQRAGELLGQPMIVENRPGGETSIGAAEVARAKPDGYSILLGGSPTHVLTPARMAKPPYDPVKDFTQLAVTGRQPLCLSVSPKSSAKSLSDIIRMAKASPGKLNYAETSSSVRLAAELFKIRAGNLDIVAVPYRGIAPALQDVLGGRIELLPAVAGAVSKYHQEGVLRVLAVLSDKRVASLPDVPTAIESGVADLQLWTFNLLCTTAGTPTPIVDQLYQATHQVLREEAFVQFLRSHGIEPVTDSTPASATQFVMEQIKVLTPLIHATRGKT